MCVYDVCMYDVCMMCVNLGKLALLSRRFVRGLIHILVVYFIFIFYSQFVGRRNSKSHVNTHTHTHTHTLPTLLAIYYIFAFFFFFYLFLLLFLLLPQSFLFRRNIIPLLFLYKGREVWWEGGAWKVLVQWQQMPLVDAVKHPLWLYVGPMGQGSSQSPPPTHPPTHPPYLERYLCFWLGRSTTWCVIFSSDSAYVEPGPSLDSHDTSPPKLLCICVVCVCM